MMENNCVFWIRVTANNYQELQDKYTDLVKNIKYGCSYDELLKHHSTQQSNYTYSKVANNINELYDKIITEAPKINDKKNNIVFLFTGQGSQLPFMGYELYNSQPVFKRNFDKCAEILTTSIGEDIRDIIFNNDSTKLNNTGFTQPALFVYEYSLAKLWQSIGIKPKWTIGHSVGEYPAASFANYLTLEDGLKLISKRASLMQSLPPGGTMAAVQATSEQMQDYISDNVEIAALNAPLQTVLSGNKESLHNTLKVLKENKIRGRELVVSHAFHSYLMDPILDDFANFADKIETRKPNIELISNVTGKSLDAIEMNGNYWRNHIRNKVNFLAGLKSLENDGANCFLEIGPQPFLTGMASKTYENDYSYLASRKNKVSEVMQVLQTAIILEEHGNNINWDNINIYIV
jgi:acyl transferase domain-containing protein